MKHGFVVRRLVVLIGVLGFGMMLTQLVTPLSDLIAIEDGLQFFLSSLVFVAAWKPTTLFFTEHPLKYARFLALAVSLWAASFMLASVWAVTWRAFGYNPTFGDTALRFGFRALAIGGSVCALAAPEFFEQEISSKRLGKFGIGLACIVLTVLLLVYGTRIRHGLLHDTAPTPIPMEIGSRLR